jgi:hypothetical protein
MSGRGRNPNSLSALESNRRPQPQNVAGLGAQASTKHGGYSPAQLAPARERHLDALRGRFPLADVTILGLQASRLAVLESVGLWLDGRGVLRNRRTGAIFSAADYWARTAAAYERQHERLEAQALAAATGDGAADYREAERRALGAGSADG